MFAPIPTPFVICGCREVGTSFSEHLFLKQTSVFLPFQPPQKGDPGKQYCKENISSLCELSKLYSECRKSFQWHTIPGGIHDQASSEGSATEKDDLDCPLRSEVVVAQLR